jgi:aryl-alcohol dehydrogenase-like predicted oxidoreductase
MKTRDIGSLSVSVVGVGCNNFGRKLDPSQSAEVVNAALDAGINYFDTSDRYGYGDHPYSGVGRSEEFLGAALGSRRSEVIVATKFGNPMGDLTGNPDDRGGSRDYVLRACEASLKRLGTDYIDLYQIHSPDPTTPVEETLGALTELVQAGKVREAGASNLNGAMIDEYTVAAKDAGTVRFVSSMNELSVMVREAERDSLPACRRNDVAFLPYFPLASGLLTGKYSNPDAAPVGSRLAFWTPRGHFGLSPELLARLEALTAIAAESGHTLLDLAMSWLLAHPEVASVIAGATSADQVRANVGAAGWEVPADVMSRIDQLEDVAIIR